MFAPVPVEELAFGMALFVNAATQPARGSRKTAVRGDRKEGERLFLAISFGMHQAIDEPARTSLLRTHLARAFFSLWDHYKGDPRRPSICARILGFCSLMEKTRGAIVAQWTASSDEGSEHVLLTSSVIQALASVTLSDQGALSEGAFLRGIEQFANDAAQTETPDKTIQETHAVASVASRTALIEGSETAALIRTRDWSTSPLGAIEQWPPSLRVSVDLTLACSFPMIVLWGPDLLQFYNDAYRDIMGAKHPSGYGQPTRKCWPEVWAINEPIYARVLRGETLTYENQLYPIIRYGFLEDAYFTLCYSPVRDEAALIQGILVTVFETTPRIKAGMGRPDPSHVREDTNDPGQDSDIHEEPQETLVKADTSSLTFINWPTQLKRK